MNFKNYKFRPSQLQLLMTRSRKKGELSETVKSALLEILIKENLGREKIIVNKYIEKGTVRENDSISLYRKVSKQFCEKNELRIENDYLIGTPDIILDDCIVDIKTSWDIFTFMSVNEKKARGDYYYQIVAYMILCNKKRAELAYCLINNSELTIYSELQKLKYTLGLNDNDVEQLEVLEEQIRRNNIYDDITNEKKVKRYFFELQNEEIEKIQTQLQMCREYLEQLNLNY